MKTRRNALSALVGVAAALAVVICLPVFGAEAVKDPAPSVAVDAGSAVSNQVSSAVSSGDTAASTHPLLMRAPKPTTGGVDPHGDSWQSIKNSFQQFGHPEFVLRLFLSLSLAVACAWAIAWHPRSSKGVDPVAELEERKALLILGVVGAIVAEISGATPTLAFVIFGIGALLRFRTVLDNPKATGKAILVVVIGLACGMGSWTMAVFVTAFSWVLLYYLDSHLTCHLTIRAGGEGDSKVLQDTVESLLLANRCRIQSCTFSKGKKRMQFLVHMPAGLNRAKLEAEIKAKLPRTGDSDITLELI